jgi:adenylate cyclase class 2
MLEIEVKAHADDLKKVEAELRKMGAQFIEDIRQIDTYYNHPCRNFAETDEALRIRCSGAKYYLAYKGKKVDPESKTRKEIEVEIEDAHTTAELLVSLGFSPVADIKKVRKVYKLDTFTVCLDDVVNVGTFVEVETCGEHVEELRNSALSILNALNLKNYERKSYLELFLFG